MACGLRDIVLIIWTVVGFCLLTYLVSFPVFMKKNMSKVTGLLERIAVSLESKPR